MPIPNEVNEDVPDYHDNDDVVADYHDNADVADLRGAEVDEVDEEEVDEADGKGVNPHSDIEDGDIDEDSDVDEPDREWDEGSIIDYEDPGKLIYPIHVFLADVSGEVALSELSDVPDLLVSEAFQSAPVPPPVSLITLLRTSLILYLTFNRK